MKEIDSFGPPQLSLSLSLQTLDDQKDPKLGSLANSKHVYIPSDGPAGYTEQQLDYYKQLVNSTGPRREGPLFNGSLAFLPFSLRYGDLISDRLAARHI